MKARPRSGSVYPLAAMLLPKATATLVAMPITSPVERISGPKMVSTPGNLANGNTLSLTATWVGTGSSARSSSSRVSPTITLAAILASGRPVALDTNGTVRDARGIDLQHVDLAILDGELHVHQAHHAQLERQSAGVFLDGANDLRV